MVYTRLISGLGNQLFQYAVGRQIALLHDAPLKLDTTFFASQSLRSYKLAAYNIRAEVATEAEISAVLAVYASTTLYARLYQKIEKRLPKRYHRRFREGEWWAYEPDLFRTSPTVHLDGYWQHYKYFEGLDPRILDELTLKKEYPAEAKVFQAAIEQDDSSVAVHIRRGDYITDTEANNLMGILPLAYYQSGIDYIKSKIDNPTFYLFSDDLAWATANLNGLGNIKPVDIAGGQQEQVEMELMSKCRHNIIANSSFSWWGAFLNRNPAKIVVSPKQWVKPPDINARIHLQFPAWIKF